MGKKKSKEELEAEAKAEEERRAGAFDGNGRCAHPSWGLLGSRLSHLPFSSPSYAAEAKAEEERIRAAAAEAARLEAERIRLRKEGEAMRGVGEGNLKRVSSKESR